LTPKPTINTTSTIVANRLRIADSLLVELRIPCWHQVGERWVTDLQGRLYHTIKLCTRSLTGA
ncbi:MAG TPA: hypothetical protein VLY63_14590, partial [Anaerolineae bacterium]|nr:hypothetical protein [Anaerolineae bacterium]